jgi:hypothetical protein
VAKSLLPPEEHWRIVNLDLGNDKALIDWMHEREWRLPGSFSFEGRAVVIVNTRADYQEFMDKAPAELLKKLSGITVIVHAIA